MNVIRLPLRSPRWALASRIVAAIGGGYMLTALATVAASLVLARAGMDRAQAVVAASMASFAVYAITIMAAFHARSATRVWAWTLGLSLPLAALVWQLLPEHLS